jgi:hypothetical protein
MQKEWAYVEKHCIECNLNAMDTYIHANTDEYKCKIPKELKAYRN